MINLIQKIILKLASLGLLKFIPDKIYLSLIYKLKIGRKLNLKNPKTFNEKIQWLKLYDRNNFYTTMVDKYEVKKYVSKIIGEKHIIPTLGVYNKFDDIDFDVLPDQFVLKCTHDSGGVIICEDKSKFDKRKARKKINKCMRRNYYYAFREWPYKNVKPRIIIEKYMVDESNVELKDYKFFCFNGIPKFLFIAKDRPYNTKFNFYDIDFNKLPFEQHYPNFDEIVKKPLGFDKMIQFSKKLSENIPHVRVDFYDINGKVYFGELTFYHFSGFEKFNPDDWDVSIGSMLKLPIKGDSNEK